MMGRAVVIVQARMGSTRFPGKMMATLGKRPVLEWVLERCRLARLVDEVILATSAGERDDPLARHALDLGFLVFRGDEDDVLGRFVGAARMARAETVIRICADRPVVAPELIDRAIETYRSQSCDLAFNHVPEMGVAFPIGMGAEVVSARCLEEIDRLSDDPMDREHVTYHLWRNRASFTILPSPCPEELAGDGLRFDLDWPADLLDLAELLKGLDVDASAAELVRRRRLRPRPAQDEGQVAT